MRVSTKIVAPEPDRVAASGDNAVVDLERDDQPGSSVADLGVHRNRPLGPAVRDHRL
jgi:hypothetical protein